MDNNPQPQQPILQLQPNEVQTPPFQEVAPSPVQLPEDNKRNLWLAIGLIMLIITILGTAGFIVYKQIQQRETLNELKSDDDASYKLELNMKMNNNVVNDDLKPTINNTPLYGIFCKFQSSVGTEITYYDSGNKYYLSEDITNPQNNSISTFNILFKEAHYYYWLDTKEESMDGNNPSVYTQEEAQKLSLDNPQQLSEVRNNPQHCQDWQVEAQKFVPPSNLEFTTTQQIIEEMKTTSEEVVKAVCEICLQEFKTRQEQLECFGITNVMTNYPEKQVEKAFDEYCFTN